MAYYVIVGHPVREKMTIEVEEYPGKKFNISIDKRKNEGKNEDPYVFTENFLYSFCHAYEAITKKIRNKVKANESVYFIFVARIKNKSKIFEIDTIIKANEIVEWPEKGNRYEKNLSFLKDDNVRKHHLPAIIDGNLQEYNRKNLYTCIGDEDKSFLPMIENSEDEYIPYRFSKELSEKIEPMLTRGREDPKGFYVVKDTSNGISEDDLDEVYGEIERLLNSTDTDCIRLKGTMLKDKRDYKVNE